MSSPVWQRWTRFITQRSRANNAFEIAPLQKSDENTTASPESADNDVIDALQTSIDDSNYDNKDNDVTLELNDDISPSLIPPELQIFRLENLALPTCYFVVGAMQGLVRPLLNVYPLELGATEAQQTTLATIVTIPAAFKLVYGFVSDNVKLCGYRRKNYMIMGWMLASICVFVLILYSSTDSFLNGLKRPTTTTTTVDKSLGETKVPPPMLRLTLTFFIFGIGMWTADVMADSLVVEKTRLEPQSMRGSLQSTCYATRFLALVIFAPLSTVLYNTEYGPLYIVSLLGAIPVLVMTPLVYYLAEDANVAVPPTYLQCQEIWHTVCQRSVWQPMAFCYLYNICQVPNAAWRQFLKTVYHFGASELNALLVVSYIMLYVGTIMYKYCFLRSSWQRLYHVCILLNAAFSLMQLLLIQGRTLGMSPFIFALGDDAFGEFLQGLQFLPLTIMMVTLCPVGSEGASYAMFTTVWNSAMMLSPALGSMLLGIWDVGEEAFEQGDTTGLYKLSVLTTLLQTLPILIVTWLPHRQEDLLALSNGNTMMTLGNNNNSYSYSIVGGAVFLTVAMCTMLWTFIVTMLNIVDPHWAGAS